MPRQRSAARVLGPHPKRDKWRLVVRDERGAESFVSYATQEEAERVKLALTGELRQRQPEPSPKQFRPTSCISAT